MDQWQFSLLLLIVVLCTFKNMETWNLCLPLNVRVQWMYTTADLALPTNLCHFLTVCIYPSLNNTVKQANTFALYRDLFFLSFW